MEQVLLKFNFIFNLQHLMQRNESIPKEKVDLSSFKSAFPSLQINRLSVEGSTKGGLRRGQEQGQQG